MSVFAKMLAKKVQSYVELRRSLGYRRAIRFSDNYLSRIRRFIAFLVLHGEIAPPSKGALHRESGPPSVPYVDGPRLARVWAEI